MQRMAHARGVLALLFTFGLLALAGCNGGTSTPPGLGQSLAAPTGTPYAMPAGITINSVIGGTHPTAQPEPIQCSGQTMASGDIYGTGIGNVDLCVQFLNGNGQPTTVTLPGGLIFLANNTPGHTASQNGFVAQQQQIVIPAGVTTVVVRAYCINKPLAPADGLVYQNNVILTDYGPMQEIVSILQPKQITTYQQAQTVQDAVWQVADGNGLSADNRAKLQNL